MRYLKTLSKDTKILQNSQQSNSQGRNLIGPAHESCSAWIRGLPIQSAVSQAGGRVTSYVSEPVFPTAGAVTGNSPPMGLRLQ